MELSKHFQEQTLNYGALAGNLEFVEHPIEALVYGSIPILLKFSEDLLRAYELMKTPLILLNGKKPFSSYENAPKARNVSYRNIDGTPILAEQRKKLVNLTLFERIIANLMKDESSGLPMLNYLNPGEFIEHYLFMPIVAKYSSEIPVDGERTLKTVFDPQLYGITKDKLQIGIKEVSLDELVEHLRHSRDNPRISERAKIEEYDEAIKGLGYVDNPTIAVLTPEILKPKTHDKLNAYF